MKRGENGRGKRRGTRPVSLKIQEEERENETKIKNEKVTKKERAGKKEKVTSEQPVMVFQPVNGTGLHPSVVFVP